MKLLLLYSLLIPLCLFSQEKETENLRRHSIGLSYSFDHSGKIGDLYYVANSYGLDYNYSYIKPQFFAGHSLTFNYRLRVNKYMSLETGLEYLRKGTKVVFLRSNLNFEQMNWILYEFVCIPLSFQFEYVPRKVGFYLRQGMNVLALINSKASDFNPNEINWNNFNTTFGTNSSLGLSVKFSNRIEYQFGFEYRWFQKKSESIWMPNWNFYSIGIKTGIYINL